MNQIILPNLISYIHKLQISSFLGFRGELINILVLYKRKQFKTLFFGHNLVTSYQIDIQRGWWVWWGRDFESPDTKSWVQKRVRPDLKFCSKAERYQHADRSTKSSSRMPTQSRPTRTTSTTTTMRIDGEVRGPDVRILMLVLQLQPLRCSNLSYLK